MASEPQSQYTVLARRFRPQAFDEVVGQEHVGQAIQNAIRSGRVAHAYLFTGARGVGKTSTARIFAKALNCPHAKDGVPCNACDVCEAISAGHDVDVLEIDGASNRGIDDIRQLRANVNVRSMRSPYKVYIIDEVHMLTKEAFNALLKTLEEPPANVKFVFCTTEPNKVPDTILSRCQRFDFGTIAQESIAERLRQIAQAEGKEVENEAVELVARRAAGSMRDSQSLFDQLLAFGGERITAQDVHRLLGTAADDRLIGLVDALIKGDPGSALQLIEVALNEGVQIGSLSDQLLAYLRDLLVSAAGAGDVPLSAVSESSRDRIQAQARDWGLQSISAAMQILAETKSKMQRVNYARALVELALVRMASLEELDQIAALLQSQNASPSGSVGTRSTGPIAPSLKKKSEPARLSGAAQEVTSDFNSVPLPVTYVDLTDSTLDEFWQQVMARAPESLAGHLKNASRRAIFGPNRLEILFPRSYLFSKSYCERPEAAKRIADAANQIAGRTIECRFAVDESAGTAKQAATPKAEPKLVERRRNSEVDDDAYVQQAISVFGAQVVEVRQLRGDPVAAAQEVDSDEQD